MTQAAPIPTRQPVQPLNGPLPRGDRIPARRGIEVAGAPLKGRPEIAAAVADALERQPVNDVHTHLYPPAFGTPVPGPGHDSRGLMLWGIDELLTYHYLVAEVFRVVPSTRLSHDAFWAMSKREQAEHVWRELFLERSPVSEACRGVITTLSSLGLDATCRDLDEHRRWFASHEPEVMIDRVLTEANVESLTMTNNVFDENERRFWLNAPEPDPRFRAAVRLDPMVTDWAGSSRQMSRWGYDVGGGRSEREVEEARRFVREWIDRTGAIYCAASLPPEFRYPDAGDGAWALERIILPVCEERGLPLALMIGARRGVNPALGDAGDGIGAADVASLGNLCAAFPRNKFLVTLLSRENQHELAVAARKFDNLMVFGCWWFVNTPSLIEEITRMRVELLGLSFIPQHSDARVLEQLIYKWRHSRQVIGHVLTDAYVDLHQAGAAVTGEAIARDVRLLLRDNFLEFLAR